MDGYREWQKHRGAHLAAGLAFYGIMACAGAALVALYIVVHDAALQQSIADSIRKTGGGTDARFVQHMMQAAALRHNSWVALAAGIILFLFAVVISSLLLKDGLDAIWDKQEPASAALQHTPQFLAILGLSFVLVLLLFAGAGIHALAYRRHRVSMLWGVFYQGGDFVISVIVLTLLFLAIFAHVAPVRSSWKKVWLASVVSAVLYERGQFGLAFYIGQMDPRSPYADIGAFVSIILWLLYSAEVVYAGAIFTKILAHGSGKSA